ncbi:MAG: sulfatase-like hydrolase/transferase [Bryobacteraceae bacterium]
MGCSRAKKPNIVLFYVDDLRATALQLYNPDALQTPNLKRLASAGIVFNHSYTPHPLCLPARVSLWTGQYSSTHGSRHNQKLMSDESTSMAGLFQQAGYSLGIFGKNHCFTPQQLTKWFAADYSIGSPGWRASLAPGTSKQISEHATWMRDQGGALMPPSAAPFAHEIFPTHLANQRAIEFVENRRQEPFLLWVSLVDPHTPIEVPEKFAGALPAGRLKLPPFREGEIKTKNTRMRIYDYLIRGGEIPDEYLARYLSVYSGKIAFLDHELGRLLDAIEAKGLRENTIFMFVSDNGDFAGEHHLMVKTGSLVDSMVRMPMILSWPASLPRGQREDALVNHVDIMPTLLRLCGLPVPSTVEGRPLPLTPDAPRRPFVYSEYGNGDAEYTWEEARKLGPAERLGDYALQTPYELEELVKRERAGHLRMIRTHSHKAIVDSNGEVEFYDLVRDPHELENAHGRPEYREEEQRLVQLLGQATIS